MRMLTLDTNLKAGNATTQYTNFDFNSMVMFNGIALGASENGIFELQGNLDDTVAIDAYFEPVTSDIGIAGPKRMRYLYTEAKINGSLDINISVDGGTVQSYRISDTALTPLRQRTIVSKILHGTYWLYQYRNVNGADFSVDSARGIFVFRNQGVMQG